MLYSRELGCNPCDFNSGGLVVVSNEKIGEIMFAKGFPLALFSIAKAGGVVVSALPRLKNAVDRVIDGKTALDDDVCDAIEHALTPIVDVRYWFRGCRLYCAPETFRDQATGNVQDVTYQDSISEALHAKWDGPVFGQIIDGKAVSRAAIKPLSDIAWDLSIQTLPEYRGWGYAKSVVSVAVKYIFENGKLAAWGTDRTNAASLNTAYSFGFQDYGLDFGCVEQTG